MLKYLLFSGAEDTECLGTAMSLQAGEGTLARKNISFMIL